MKFKQVISIFLIILMISVNSAAALEWQNVSDLPEKERINVEQTKTLESEFDYPNTFKQVDAGSNFYRYKIFCNANINKCGLYDKKKDKFTGYKYKYEIKTEKTFSGEYYLILNEDSKDNEIIGNTFSGVPIVIEDGKKISVQPMKRIGNSIVRGLYYTVYGIIILPVAIPYGIMWLITGQEDAKTVQKWNKEHNKNIENSTDDQNNK